MMKRCKATTVLLGNKLRCEAEHGHDSVHYSGKQWWPNAHGFPYPHPHRLRPNQVLIIAWILAAVIMAGAIFIVLAHK